jgi:hypothetical protein
MYSRGSADLPGYLFDGRTQTGIFYHSEAHVLGNRVAAIELSGALDLRDRTQFPIGAVRRNGTIDPRAQPVVEWCLGARGQALLERHGFLPVDRTGAAR